MRIHKFGIEDEGSMVTDITRRPSYLRMQDFAAADKAVRVLLTRERVADADSDFADIDTSGTTVKDTDWMSCLDYDRKGALKSTINNIVAVLENDPGLKDHLYLDLLRNNISVISGLPWDAKAVSWSNRDDANLRGWLENAYGVSGKDKVRDALDMVITRHRRHPIREYLNGLSWDGVPRLERLIIDYAGAEDSRLNRAITRIHFTAAVARVMDPGCKYDYCLILAGPQGAGKSTLISIMGGDYYKDGLTSMEGKEGAEQVRGAHLIEIGELDGMKRSELSAVKQFITARSDEYRPAYAVHKEVFPRQCVFFGTTNERHFLKDETGNRRFPIIPVRPELRKHGARWFEQLLADRDQLWAEAVEYWKRGDRLYLPDDLEAEARQRQGEYSDNGDDPLMGLLAAFLDTRLPADWDSWELLRRRAWLRNPDPLSEDGVMVRDRVCAAEFICERMGRDMTDKEYKYLSRKVCAMLDRLGWKRIATSRHVERLYGRQKGFERPQKEQKADEDSI
ncbi:MAG: virulence-associated E family protein [Pseudoflavonifractor sp.]|nr:virulence-associated E family protein [Pseudoflavonifractor sp.]